VKLDQLVNRVYKASLEGMVILGQPVSVVLVVLLDDQKTANKVSKETKVQLACLEIVDSAVSLEKLVIKELEVFLVNKAPEVKKERKVHLVQLSKVLLGGQETSDLPVSPEERDPQDNPVFQDSTVFQEEKDLKVKLVTKVAKVATVQKVTQDNLDAMAFLVAKVNAVTTVVKVLPVFQAFLDIKVNKA